jgi:hypothetical protein
VTTTAEPSASRSTAGVYAGYLWVQAAMGVVLWVGIATVPTVREWFELDPDMPAITDAFFLADMGVVVASAFGAWGVSHGRRWAPLAVGVAFGGVLYPTIYLVAWVPFTDGVGGVALAVMLVTSTLCGLVLYQVYQLDRSAEPAPPKPDPLTKVWPAPPPSDWPEDR